MILATITALAPFVLASAIQENEVRAKFVELAAKQDEAALAELWSRNPDQVLVTIDEDLEGSLSTWERATENPDQAAIRAQQERALWGARIASVKLGEPIFHDYAAAFVGWNAEQKKSFRAGQAAHGRARKALKSGDHAAAAKAARECADLALPLGDWWGYAMGLAAEGQALLAGSDKERAVVSLSQARAVYVDLELAGDAFECSKSMAKALHELGQTERAFAALGFALTLVRPADASTNTEFLELAAAIKSAHDKR